MYEHPLPCRSYLYYVDHPRIPRIDQDLNVVSISDLQESADLYLAESPVEGDSLNYKNEVIRRVQHRDYVLDRFQKDLCGVSITISSGGSTFTGSLSKIDLVRNECMANEKSNEVYQEASRNVILHRSSGLEIACSNFHRLFTTIMVKDDLSGLIYSTFESPVIYDQRSISVVNAALSGHDQFSPTEDEEVDSSKTYWSRNGQVFTEVVSPSGSPVESGWFEKTENQVNFIIEEPNSESTRRVFNSWNPHYVETEDEEALSGKLYYTKSGEVYSVAEVIVGQQLTGTYYEESFLASENTMQYTLRYNGGASPHWYIAEISVIDGSITVGPEILVTESIDSSAITWATA